MKIYNPISQKVQAFETLERNSLKIYVCGITPYDTTHIGHAFTYTFFDVLIRYFQYKGFIVNYTQNVTDIDDDILKRAKKEKTNWQELGDIWTEKFLKDMQWLNNKIPNHYVKATDSINKMIQIIQVLLDKGAAYRAGSNIYFEVSKFPDYGKLSHLSIREMIEISRERGADPDDSNKKDPLDFILWQSSKNDEPFWDSPWGIGRPGWHIECSAMINQYLGDQIDIHGGGKDLDYPHHESEIAQSETYTGKKPFVKNWMHTAMVSFEGEKVSKSLGNLVLISDLAKSYSSASVRLLLVSHHYRKPWEFKESELINCQKTIELFNKALKVNSESNENIVAEKFVKEFDNCMNTDVDIPEAIELLKKMADLILNHNNLSLKTTFKKLIDVLGLNL